MKRRRLNRIARVLALGLAIAAIAAPIASARPLGVDGNPIPTTAGVAPVDPTGPSARAASASSDFDWGDAAIGFGVAAGLALIAAAGFVAVRGRRLNVSSL
jgi:hypothetical protein